MKITINQLLMLIVIFLVLLVAFPTVNGDSIALELFIYLFIIGIISIFEIIKSVKKRAYTLNMMHWVFIFFFFFLAPIIQITNNFYPWGIRLTIEEQIRICLYIILWIVFYKFGNFILNKIHIPRKEYNINYDRNISRINLWIITFISIFCAVIVIKNVGLKNLFSTHTAGISYDGNYSKMSALVIGHCTKAAIVFSFSISLLNFYTNKNCIFNLLVNSLILLITCFPTGLARNTAGTIYMGILVIYFYRDIKKYTTGIRYMFIFILAFMILFPAINVFRNLDFKDVDFARTLTEVTNNISSNYLSGDYDAFSVIGDTKRYVDLYDLSYGKQMLGSVLFFFPRNIWDSKPGGSGQLVFESLGMKYTNISSPMVAESYINFGVVGIMIYGVIFGFTCSYIDKIYWNNIEKNGSNYCIMNILYPFILPSYFFMLRGDWQSTIAYMMAYVVVFLILYRMSLLKFKRSKEVRK